MSVLKVYCRCVIDAVRVAELSMLYNVNANSNHSLFNELASASTRVRYTRDGAPAHSLEFKESRRRMSQFARFLVHPADSGSIVE